MKYFWTFSCSNFFKHILRPSFGPILKINRERTNKISMGCFSIPQKLKILHFIVSSDTENETFDSDFSVDTLNDDNLRRRIQSRSERRLRHDMSFSVRPHLEMSDATRSAFDISKAVLSNMDKSHSNQPNLSNSVQSQPNLSSHVQSRSDHMSNHVQSHPKATDVHPSQSGNESVETGENR